MSPDIATIVISSISALAAVIRAWSVAKQRKWKITSKGIDWAERRRKKPILTENQIESLSKVISDDIFQAILGNISEAKESFIAKIKDPNCNAKCQEKQHENAAKTICQQLKIMKKLNNNQLPKKLENLWISFQCK